MNEQAGIANLLTTFFGSVAEDWTVWLTRGLIIVVVAALAIYAIRWSFKKSVAAYEMVAKTIPSMADKFSAGVPLIKTLTPYLLGTMIMHLGKAIIFGIAVLFAIIALLPTKEIGGFTILLVVLGCICAYQFYHHLVVASAAYSAIDKALDDEIDEISKVEK